MWVRMWKQKKMIFWTLGTLFEIILLKVYIITHIMNNFQKDIKNSNNLFGQIQDFFL